MCINHIRFDALHIENPSPRNIMKIGDLEKKMYIKFNNFAIQRTVSLNGSRTCLVWLVNICISPLSNLRLPFSHLLPTNVTKQLNLKEKMETRSIFLLENIFEKLMQFPELVKFTWYNKSRWMPRLHTNLKGARSYFSNFSFVLHLKDHHTKYINLQFQ